MSKTRILATCVCLGLASLPGPALAWETTDTGPFSFLSHRYGDDMYQPPNTPDRPYWHGDDAVPPDLRWHDRQIEIVDEYGFTVATRVPGPEVVSTVPVVRVDTTEAPGRRRAHRRRARSRHPSSRLAAGVCPPPLQQSAPAFVAVPNPPPVPAPTEH